MLSEYLNVAWIEENSMALVTNSKALITFMQRLGTKGNKKNYKL